MATYYASNDSKGRPYDAKLDELFHQKRHGFFVELGAFNGIDHSNTAFFEFYRNWKGILIEPSFQCYEQCVMNRPNSTCVHAACVSSEYTSDTIDGDFNNITMASVGGARLNSDKNTHVRVPAMTLESIFDKVEAPSIDFLSLDAEGYELEILKGLNFVKYRPIYMLIEVYRHEYDSILSYLEKHDYELLSNFSEFNYVDNPGWDGTHQDFLFMDKRRKFGHE